LVGWELWGFWRVEGLDRKTGVREQGTGNRRQGTGDREQGRTGNGKGKGLGLKPVSSRGMGLPRLKPGPISGTKTRARTNTEILAAPE
jgi:hypothetical protein